MSYAHQRRRGFTLIELMIVVALIAVLSAFAIPSYRDHVIRGRLVDASNGLNTIRADMERHFQDNRTFATVTAGATTRTLPCQRPAAELTFGKFVISCTGADAPSPTAYKLTATGTGDMSTFGFTVDQLDRRTTTTTYTDWTAANPNTNTCWVLKRRQTC